MPVPCKSKCALCLSHYGAGAVADGNAEANGFAGAAGTMEAIYIGNDTNWWRTRPGPNHKQQQQQGVARKSGQNVHTNCMGKASRGAA
jgi:hypothetical protein